MERKAEAEVEMEGAGRGAGAGAWARRAGGREWQLASAALHASDAVLAAVAWRRRDRAVGAVLVLRAAAHAARERLVRPTDRATMAVATAAGFTALHLALVRLARQGRVLRWLAAALGPAQLVAWARCHPETLPGVAVKVLWLLASELRALCCRQFRLEGTPLMAKRSFPTEPKGMERRWVAEQLESHPVVGKLAPFTITSLEAEEVDTQLLRLRLAYAGSDDPQLPHTLLAKLPATDLRTRLSKRFIGQHCAEVRFYKEFAPRLRACDDSNGTQLQVLEAYATYQLDDSADSCLLLEDAGKLSRGDPLNGASWQQACSVAARYARFHALSWSANASELDKAMDAGWLKCYGWMSAHPELVNHRVQTDFCEMMREERFAQHVPAHAQRALKLLVDNLPLVLARLSTGPLAVVHGECRLHNMLWPVPKKGEERTCRPGMRFDDVYDRAGVRWVSVGWEALAKGKGVFDLASFAALDLEVGEEAGQQCDRLLVEHYYDQLVRSLAYRASDSDEDGFSHVAARGSVEALLGDYSMDACWHDYRLCVLLAALAPIVAPRTTTCPALRVALLRRCVAALTRVESEAGLVELLRATQPVRTMSGALATYRAVEDQMLVGDADDAEAPLMLRSVSANDEDLTHWSPALLRALPAVGPPGTSQRDTFDRWFLNGYSRRGNAIFAATLAVYPGRRVVDAAFSIVMDGAQHNVRASRRLSEAEWPVGLAESDEGSTASSARVQPESRVGPIRISVLEPLRRVQLEVVMPDDVTAKLTFETRFPASMEPPYDTTHPHVGAIKFDRMTQLVKWNGFIDVGRKRRIEVVEWAGSRSRSWGLCPHPGADASPLSARAREVLLSNRFVRQSLVDPVSRAACPQTYWFQSVASFEEGGATYHSQQAADGAVQNGAASVLGDPFGSRAAATPEQSGDPFHAGFFAAAAATAAATTEPGAQSGAVDAPPAATFGRCEGAGHSVQYLPGTRHAKSCTVVLAMHDGRRLMLAFEPLGVPLFLGSLGFDHGEWAHGRDHGDRVAVQADAFHTSVQDRNAPANWRVQELCAVTARLFEANAPPEAAPEATSHGVAAVEQLVLGPHAPSGFVALMDSPPPNP